MIIELNPNLICVIGGTSDYPQNDRELQLGYARKSKNGRPLLNVGCNGACSVNYDPANTR